MTATYAVRVVTITRRQHDLVRTVYVAVCDCGKKSPERLDSFTAHRALRHHEHRQPNQGARQ